MDENLLHVKHQEATNQIFFSTRFVVFAGTISIVDIHSNVIDSMPVSSSFLLVILWLRIL